MRKETLEKKGEHKMRARNIKPGFFKNENLSDLGNAAKVLFAGLWCLADRGGNLEDRPRRIKAEIFPYEEIAVESLLNDLARGNDPFVYRYEVEGVGYVHIVNFEKHQHPHHQENKIHPEPGQTPDKSEINPRSIRDKTEINPSDSPILNTDSPILKEDSLETEPGATPGDEIPSESKNPTDKNLGVKATEILKAYGERVKPPGEDNSRFRAKKHVIKILKYGFKDEEGETQKVKDEELLKSIDNYQDYLRRKNWGSEFAKSSGNYFGKDSVFINYLPGKYEPGGGSKLIQSCQICGAKRKPDEIRRCKTCGKLVCRSCIRATGDCVICKPRETDSLPFANYDEPEEQDTTTSTETGPEPEEDQEQERTDTTTEPIEEEEEETTSSTGPVRMWDNPDAGEAVDEIGDVVAAMKKARRSARAAAALGR